MSFSGAHQPWAPTFPDLCPDCHTFFLTTPKASVGYHSPDNEGRIYQKCPRNNFSKSSPSPEVAQKIINGDFTFSPSRRQKEAYRLEAACMITVKWWLEDNATPIVFSVPVTGFPWFHPKDCSAITERLEFTLADDDCWILTPTAVRVKADSIIYMRRPGVQASQFFSFEFEFEFGFQKADIADSDSDNDKTELPPQPNFEIPILQGEPPRGRKTPWPLRFACDMDIGFKRIESLPGTPASNFKDVFGCEWVRATYSENFNAWKNTYKPGLAAAIRAGRSDGGEWAPIVKAYRAKTRG
ncbi:hypothetical protein B0H15DRAFT_799955 [Mycena belliarum]|uniref:Uncharacterized protein n=1 Tax=Mycena belliarum TaxID=1033014 RepID=A0AAD6XNL4_9AGAR|nr:hypothetical protein B0H15DRAFT_799955 [Mycena belliae]